LIGVVTSQFSGAIGRGHARLSCTMLPLRVSRTCAPLMSYAVAERDTITCTRSDLRHLFWSDELADRPVVARQLVSAHRVR
jgi:hypothetical protein